jgi:predicted MFS family arabinose efflux permease
MLADDPLGTAAEAETRNPFASARFTRWWLGSIIAGAGVGIQAVTVPLFIRDRVATDARALAIAGALIAQTLPGAVLALVGGAVADRIERRRILVRTYAIAALVSSAYVLLSGFDVRAIWPVFPLAAVVGAAGAFTNPARQSMLPQLVSRAQLQNGIIFGTMAFMAMLQFLGPTIGGVVADLRGLTTAFALEVGLLSLAALIFSGVSTDQPVRSGRNVLGDLADGVRYVVREPAIRGLLLLGTVPGVFMIGPFAVTVALVVPDVFHATDKWVGMLWGCFGAGVVFGSLTLTLRALPNRGLAVCMSILTGGVVLIAYGCSTSLYLSAGLLFIWGLSPAVFINYVVALVQEQADPRMMGRVMSMYSLAFLASSPIGFAQAGLVTSRYGPQTTLVASGVIATGIGVLCLILLKPVRALK